MHGFATKYPFCLFLLYFWVQKYATNNALSMLVSFWDGLISKPVHLLHWCDDD